MLSSVTSWWGGEKPETGELEQSTSKDESASDSATEKSARDPHPVDASQPSSPDAVERETTTNELGDVSAKAVNTAKEWGSK